MLKRGMRPGKAPVQSFLVQADVQSVPVHPSRKQTLVRHLLSRFQADDTGDEEQSTHRILFLAATAAIPPLFIAVMLYPAYHPLTIVPVHRPYWSQVGDEYLYVLYSLLAMGIASLAQWDAIFPDLLDVFALSLLPLPGSFLLRSRCTALALFFGVVLLLIDTPAALAFPLVVEGPNVLRHLVAHAVATLAAGIFACAVVIAIQAVLELAFGVRLARLIAPCAQTATLLSLFTLLGLTPALLHGLHQIPTGLFAWLPPLWFLGMYEQLRGPNDAGAVWSLVASRGAVALGLSVAVVIFSYPAAYARRSLFLIQSGNTAGAALHLPSVATRLLHRILVPVPAARASFHFVAQSIFRILRFRSLFTIYAGFGIACILAVGGGRTTLASFVLTISVLLGIHAAVGKRFMPRSLWMFRILPATGSAYAPGVVAIATLWATVASATFATAWCLHLLLRRAMLWRTGTMLLATSLLLPYVLAVSLFARRSAFPMTDEPEPSPERYVLLVLANAVLLPAALASIAWSAGHASRTILGALLWALALAAAALAARAWNQRDGTGVPGPT